MTQTKLIKTQTQDAYDWVNTLVKNVPSEKWDHIPKVLNTNLNWQVGHLILSFNFHTIMVIRDHQFDLYQKFPIQEYATLFVKADPKDSVGKTKPAQLLEHLDIVQQKSLEIIGRLSDAELTDALEPTDFPHPIATNKLEALNWNIKHTMWHCGQMALLKRVLGHEYDFWENV